MTYKRWFITLRCIPLLLVMFAVSGAVFAGDPRIAVLYPEASGGYKQVFNNMVEGVEQLDNVDVISMELVKQPETKRINDWLIENRVDSVIALGSTSYSIAGQLPDSIPVTVGALVLSPDGFSGISLAGDPELFIEHLRNLAPDVRRVHVIYSKKNSEWLMDIARDAARRQEIELVAYQAYSVKDGLQQYDRVLDEVEGTTDAIWIPLDTVVPDKLILPKLLTAAWDKQIVVFSNNPLHAKRGVLFALFPDHRSMGSDLGRLALEQITARNPQKVLPARNLKLAVNKRTASHLGFSYSKNQQRQFDIVFPSE